MSAALRQAAEAVLKNVRYPSEARGPTIWLEVYADDVAALRSALAADAAEEERARAAESVAYAAVIAHYNAALEEPADA